MRAGFGVVKIRICECGHGKHLHKIFEQESGCTVGILSNNPCACKQFRPTPRALDVCPQCREIIKPYTDIAGNKFCPSCGKRQYENGILNHTDVGDILYEPFAGSGTGFIAAQNTGRRCYGMELSPEYCAVILERMAQAFQHIEIEKIE